MKKSISLLGAAVIAVCALFTILSTPEPAHAQNVPTSPSTATAFSTVGQGSVTNAGSATNVAWAIIPAGAGRAALTFAQFMVDGTNNGLRFSYAMPTNVPVQVTLASNAAQSFCYVVPTGITNNDVCIIRYLPNTPSESYQRLVVSNATATNVTFTASVQACSSAFTVGDMIYKVTTNAYLMPNASMGTVAAGGTTNYMIQSASGAFNGPYGAPVLVEAYGNTNQQIFNLSGFYRNP